MVTTLNRQNPRRLDAAPTEVQMKLGISQVLSMPFAYNSPVIVLDFEVGNKNIIKGRFKDAIRSRVFEFEIGDSITFKPFTWRRTDSDVDPMAWEDFSKGYCYRFDAVKTVRKEKPKCGNTSYNCGKACIGLNKNCKSDPPDKPSQEKVDKLRAAAGEFKAVQGDPTKKQEDNKLTPKPQEVKEVAPTPSPDKAEVPVTDLAKQPPVALKIGKKSVNLKDDLDSYKDLRITADPVLGWQVINKNGNVLREPPKGNTAPSHRFKKREQAEKFANDVMTRVEKLQKAQPKPDADVSDSDKRSFESLYTTKLSSAQQLLNLEKNAKIARISPSEDQKNYDKKQPDLNIDSGPGIMEGWRTAKPDGSVQGIPWSVKAEGQEKSRAIVGARLTDHPASPNLKRLRLYDADGRNETIDFKKGDRNASLRARRLVREIAQGKSQEMESGDIKALIEGGKEGLAKRKVEKARLAAEDKQFKAALDDYLKSKNLTRESIKGLTDIGMDDLIEKVEKYQKSRSQTPNSAGDKGAGGKTFDLNDLWRQTADAAYSKNKDGVSKNLEQWKEVVKKLESGEGISKDVNLNEYEKLMDNLEKKLVLDPKDPSNVEFKKITGSISKILSKAGSLNPLTQEDLEKAHPNFRPIMQRINKTVAKDYELFDKKERVQKELNSLKQEKSYNEAVILNNSKRFREIGINNNEVEIQRLSKKKPSDSVEVRNPVSNLPERTISASKRIKELQDEIGELNNSEKAKIEEDRARKEIARLQSPMKDAESRINAILDEKKKLRESRGGSSSQSEPKQTPNSVGVDGAGGKSVDQQYKDIIAKSKDPKGTEEVLSSALRGGFGDFERKNYNEYSTAIKSGTVPKGMGNYYQKQVDKYKPIIEAEDFINERKKKAISGDYETEQEAGVYVLNKLKQKGYKEHEYYDSPDYEKDYGKLVGVMKSVKLPPPLSGIVPGKELKQTLTPGDKLLVKEDTYSLMSSGNTPTGYRIVDGGEVLKVNVKNVKTRVRGEYMGKPYENEPSLALDKVTHVIRDGKRYKVDDSDRSPNDLKSESSKSQKAVKQKAVKQKAIKVQGERSQKQESPLIPKEEIVKDAPILMLR
jgi:hypothetical protein